MREIKFAYCDPLDLIWIHAAGQLGMTVLRDPTVFASWDGQSTLRIGTPETLDPDDSLAQMILHEICHWLVAGPDSIQEEDWGLVYAKEDDVVSEHASLRLQAKFADCVGLRTFCGSTTDFRAYYDALPEDPLESNGDPAVALAQAAWDRAQQEKAAQVILQALERTREIANVVGAIAPPSSLWSVSNKAAQGVESLREVVTAPANRTP